LRRKSIFVSVLLALVCAAQASAQHNRIDLVSTGPTDDGSAPVFGSNGHLGVSDDGTRVFFEAGARFVATDTDAQGDVYMRAGGVTTLVSVGPSGGNGNFSAAFKGNSADGSHAYFTTAEALVSGDTDGRTDLYDWSAGGTTLVTTGPAGGNGPVDNPGCDLSGGGCLNRMPGAISDDGSHVFFGTTERLVAGDTDSQHDVYERAAGVTRLISTGPMGGNGNATAFFEAASDDGTRVFFSTAEKLTSNDPDGTNDIYRREGAVVTLMTHGSSGDVGGRISRDGARFFYGTEESLVPADTDGQDACEDPNFGPRPCYDVYEYTSAGPALVSARTDGTGGTGSDSRLAGISDDGQHVYFTTGEQLAPEDTDGLCTRVLIDPDTEMPYDYVSPCEDVYERSGGVTRLVSVPPSATAPDHASFQGASSDGGRVFFGTKQPMVSSDTNGELDLFERAGAVTTHVSVGPAGSGWGSYGGTFTWPSPDGSRVVFLSLRRLVAEDTDNYPDVYERFAGRTQLITDFTTAEGPVAVSADRQHVFFEVFESAAPGDTCAGGGLSCFDIYDASVGAPSGYPRPKGATPIRVPLVPAFAPCTAPNRSHGTPLAFPSCGPPTQSSESLTVGTDDANGNGQRSIGFVLLTAKPGNSATEADDADVTLRLSLTDVRVAGSLADYAGELQGRVSIRLTDNNSSAPITNPLQTVQDFPLSFTAACTPTTNTLIGGSCAVLTTADALVPGMVREDHRNVWQLEQVEVLDGGPDGDVDTPGNTVFARQGVFVP
jgi:hypothetical protein